MTTQGIVTHNVTAGSLGSLDEKQKLSERVLSPVDDRFDEIDPKEERAFV